MDVECIYCYNLTTEGDAPTVDDDEMWDAIAPEHDPDCEWVVTRAHRILGNLALEA
jgi:hypothetical protein